ncbi:MAG: arginyl-tRNA synthetase [Verrucomicrobiales bacterium]|nr:arginyl-tRNA synthetase [Verrucomicrobiales bacterium]
MTFLVLLQQRAAQALAASGHVLPDQFQVTVDPAADTRFGDYQTNAAMVLAKALKTNPRALATELAEKMDVSGISAQPTVAGPGFINFTITPAALATRLEEMLADEKLGVPPAAEPKTIVIDFSAPNVAKQMHVGHIRSTIIGDCLARIARFLGHTVVTDNHIGDWGTQFGMVLHGWKQGLNEEALLADPIRELLRVYKAVNAESKAQEEAVKAGERTDTPIRDACRAELVKLQAGDPENMAIWKRCVDVSLAGLSLIYQKLDIQFDHYLGESFYNDRLPSLVAELEAKGLARESEGALCIFFDGQPELGDKAPFIIRKTDGGYGYATTDLATIEHRVKVWQADEVWYVVGAPQSLHFSQLFDATRRWGMHPRMEHVAFGSILGEDGRMMKTRSGESVGLQELLGEAEERALAVVQEKNPELTKQEKAEIGHAVGIGAVKYMELSQHRLTDYKFSWEKMLSFNGNTAPYLQNAYVRTRGIFRKLDGPAEFPGPYELAEESERWLALTLSRFAEVVPSVLEDFRPNLLASYLFTLAQAFHSFFEACPVLRAEGQVRATRLALCEATSRVLRTGLNLMGIRVTERM